MKFFYLLSIFAGKCVFMILKLLGRSGSTWPGEIAMRIFPDILPALLEERQNVVFVTGTNGKTTTVKMIETILTKNGKTVRRNAAGANLINGIVSTILEDASFSGTLSSDVFVFEIDEAALPQIIPKVRPSIIVLLNLFRDQLDRYGEVDTIAEKWQRSLERLSLDTTVLINGDDPHLSFLGENLITTNVYFGLDDSSLFLQKVQHATDSLYCPKCGRRLSFGGVYFSHLGMWACNQCGFTHPKLAITRKDIHSPVPGVYNDYNTMAAFQVGRILGLQDSQIAAGLTAFTPAFGRMEEIERGGKHIKILLAKNPTGFNESLRAVMDSKSKGAVVLVLNDRIPDGRDVSWIWDVDFELFLDPKKDLYVSGDRAHDLALRLSYAGIEASKMHVDTLPSSLARAEQETPNGETVWILPTYSAMLDVRNLLIGRKLL